MAKTKLNAVTYASIWKFVAAHRGDIQAYTSDTRPPVVAAMQLYAVTDPITPANAAEAKALAACFANALKFA